MTTATTALPQLFSGRLRPFPGIREDWSAPKRAQAASILADVQGSFPELLTDVDPGADFEDFWEDAARISAAWRASGGNLALKSGATPSSPWTDEERARRLGPVTTLEDGGHHAVDKLVNHPLVQEHGGRALLRGSIGGDPATDVVSWLAARHRDHGVKRGVVKTAANKNGIWSIELDSDPAVIADRLLDVMGWTYVRLEELPEAVFAQDALELEYEYRLFIVDGELVSGAGCVEEFTPLDRKAGESFDTRVRRVRGHLHQGEPSVVEDRPDVVARLLAFGQQVARKYGGTVVIDVALDRVADQPVVIELNELSNSGLYASDPWLVTEKLVQSNDRGYRL